MQGVTPLTPRTPFTPLSKMRREAAGDKGGEGGEGGKGGRVGCCGSSAILGAAALGRSRGPGAASRNPRLEMGQSRENPWSPAGAQLLPGMPGERDDTTVGLQFAVTERITIICLSFGRHRPVVQGAHSLQLTAGTQAEKLHAHRLRLTAGTQAEKLHAL